MNNTLKRAITGGVFIATLIFCSIWSKLSLVAIFLFFTIIGTYEYLNIVKSKNKPNKIIAYLLSILTFVLISDGHFNEMVFLLPLLFSLFIFELFRSKENGFENILHSIMPGLYVALPFGLIICAQNILNQPAQLYSPALVLVFFYTLWSNDTGAFLAGKNFGKHKLFPKISPNKTWEGTIGGAILALIIAYISASFFKELSAIEWMGMALIVVVFGSLGDLVESMLKRNYGVKDSGKILPGHGGILDRFDGLLLASPMVYTYITILYYYKHFP